MSEGMDSLESVGTVPELETEEFTVFGGSTFTKFDHKSRCIVSYGTNSSASAL